MSFATPCKNTKLPNPGCRMYKTQCDKLLSVSDIHRYIIYHKPCVGINKAKFHTLPQTIWNFRDSLPTGCHDRDRVDVRNLSPYFHIKARLIFSDQKFNLFVILLCGINRRHNSGIMSGIIAFITTSHNHTAVALSAKPAQISV